MDKRVEKLTSPSGWWSWLKKHPVFVAIGFILTFFGVFGDLFSAVGFLASNIYEIVHAPDNIIFRWMFVVAGLGLIWIGILRSETKGTAAKEEIKNSIERESAQRREERGIIIQEFRKAVSFQRLVSAAFAKKAQLEYLLVKFPTRDFHQYFHMSPATEEAPPRLEHVVKAANTHGRQLAEKINELMLRIDWKELGEPSFRIDITTFSEPVAVLNDTGNGKIVRPKENVELFRAHGKLIQQLERAHELFLAETHRLRRESQNCLVEIANWEHLPLPVVPDEE